MGAIFDLEIPSAEKLVLLAMADHARDDGTGCYPAIGTLAKKTSLSRRGTQKLIRRLQVAGFITDTGKLSRLGTVEYTLTLDRGGRTGFAPISAPGGANGRPLGGRTRRRKGANPVRPNQLLITKNLNRRRKPCRLRRRRTLATGLLFSSRRKHSKPNMKATHPRGLVGIMGD